MILLDTHPQLIRARRRRGVTKARVVQDSSRESEYSSNETHKSNVSC